ncbi:MAG: biopolymer transporter ExbD [Pontiellaceae bacterium]|nr:biopolymer transporter ExbD [Pontiellaceae bacterium]
MFDSVQQRESGEDAGVSVDIAPLIDLVFTLLIFFLVTATFTQDLGVAVSRPESFYSQALTPQSLRIVVTETGAIYTDGKRMESRDLLDRVRRFTTGEKTGSVVIVSDENVSARMLVSVIDIAKQGGAVDVAIATREKGAPQ